MRKTFFISLLALCLTASAWAVNVAKIGTTEYATLAEAISAATAGQTVQLIADINQANGVLINKDLTLDLNNHTYTCTNGSNVNSRAIKITAGTVAIQNGTIIGETTANFEGGCYGPIRIEGLSTSVTLQNLTLQNGRHYGLGIKLVEGYLKMENCTVISNNGGGGLEVAGTADVINCTFTQTGLDNAQKWISTCFAACDNGVLNVSGGTYTSEHWSLYIYTSGGEMDIEGGNFTGDVITQMDNHSYPSAVGIINITDGTFEGAGGSPVNFTATTDNDHITISGGSFDAPVPAAYCAEGFVPVTEPDPVTGKYVVEQVSVAKIGDTYYATLPAAVAAAIQSNSASVTIELVGTPGASIQGSGVKIPTANKTIIIDFKGMTYVAGDPAVGSTGTETQAFQLLRDNNITLKNGTITSLAGSNVKMLIQNYSNLTLENITLDGSNLNIAASGAYTLSNNNGDVVIGNGTEVIAKDGGFAFDVCYYASYPSVHVTVEDGATINGAVEMSMSNGRGATVEENCELTIEGGEFTNFSISHTNIPEESVNSNISAGTFDAPVPEVYCAEGFVSVTAPNAQGLYVVEQVDYQREVTNTYGTLCLPKSGVVIGATVFQPSYRTGCMIFFDEVAENRIEGGHAYLFQRKADFGRVSVKYDDPNAQDADIVENEAMVGKSYTENTLIDPNYDHCIVWNDKYLHVTSANVYVGAKCAYIDLNQISDSYVAPVPGRRRISFQDASVNEVTGIEDIEANENAGVQKVMINGQLYILRGEQIYNVAGQVVK